MKNEFQVTKELYMSWGKENAHKGSQLAFRIFWCVMSVIFLCLAISLFFLKGVKIYHFIYLVLLLFYCVYRAFFRNMILTDAQYQKNEKIFGKNWVRTIEFGEDEITSTDGTVIVRTPYSQIVGMRDDGNKIWLDTKKKMVIRLYKDKFVDGDFEMFKKFISVKIVK